jgi:hypothetical protein
MRQGLFVMSRVCVALLAGCLLGVALTACSRAEVPDVAFKPTRAVKETDDPQAALEEARLFCQEEARRKGIANMTAIVLRRGKVSKSDYVDCMEAKGYDAVD